MTILFVTNYYNHHQSAVSRAFAALEGVEYKLIETEYMELWRRSIGWSDDQKPDFVVKFDELKANPEKYQLMIDEADVVICGNAPQHLFKTRLKAGKLTFAYSERIYKRRYEPYKFPIRFVRFWKKFGRYKNLYMLCASAFTAADFAKTFTFLNKTYKWGYFPELYQYGDIEELIETKKKNSFVWAARMLSWKHPEAVIEVARRLKRDGFDFEIAMIGSGELKKQIKVWVEQFGLEEHIKLPGVLTPEQVREQMEQSEIYLFTSDRNEGWGAVLNESMNSACAVVASHAIGSVPFMIRDGENGLIYQDGDVDALYHKVRWLIEHPEERKRIAKNAYVTLTEEWNAEYAVKRFVELAEQIRSGNKRPNIFEDGPCSKAAVIKDDWYGDKQQNS